jgi:hypothetical protein
VKLVSEALIFVTALGVLVSSHRSFGGARVPQRIAKARGQGR